jgi:hypothetical protein
MSQRSFSLTLLDICTNGARTLRAIHERLVVADGSETTYAATRVVKAITI